MKIKKSVEKLVRRQQSSNAILTTSNEVKSSDCGPGGSGSVRIKEVTGEGADAASAIKSAHTTAKTLGQASCDGGGCQAAKSCRYVEDNWEASVVFKDNKWIATGTSAGHCACE
jgi:hypothetical protein